MCVTAASVKYELQLGSEAEPTLSECYASFSPAAPTYVPSSLSSPPSPTASPDPNDPKPVPIVWPQPSRVRARRSRGRQYKEPQDEQGQAMDCGAAPFTFTPTIPAPPTPNQTPIIGQVHGDASQGNGDGQMHPRVQKWMSRAEVMAGSAGLSPTAIAMARRTAEIQLAAAAAQMSGAGVNPEKAFAQISKETEKLSAQFKEMGGSAFAQFARTAGPLPLNGLSPDKLAEGVRQAAGPVLAEVAQITRSSSGSKFRKTAKQVAATLKDAAGPALSAKSLGDIKGPVIAAGSLLAAAAQGARSGSSKSFGKLGLAAGLIGGLVTAGTAMYVQRKQEKKDRQRLGGGDEFDKHEGEDEDEGYFDKSDSPSSISLVSRNGSITTHERTGLPVDEFSNTGGIPILYLHV